MIPTNIKKKNWFSRLSFKLILIGTLLISGLLIASIILTTVFLTRDSKNAFDTEEDTTLPVSGTVDPSVKLTNTLRILSRQRWLARHPKQPALQLKTPLSLVIIAHTTTENCTQMPACIRRMRDIQNFNMDSNGWMDIEYNFAVGGDGYAYKGRGWTSQGVHTYGYNAKSIGIGFIGTFNHIQPPERQIKAALDLMQEGVRLNYLTKDYKVVAQKQLQRTLSPGEKLYKIMTNWTHWSEEP